jgi:hypothetical protein
VDVRSIVLFVSAAVLGGVAYWGFNQVQEERRKRESASAADDEPSYQRSADPPPSAAAPEALAPAAAPGEDPALARPAPGTSVLKRPIFFSGDPDGTPRAEAASGATAGAIEPAAAGGAPPAAPSPEAVRATALDADRNIARAAFDSGDRERGVRLLEEVYAVWKEKPGTDLSPEVQRLLQSEKELARRRGYLQYLARFDRPVRLCEEEVDRALKRIPAADSDPEAAFEAWNSLTLAYDLAPDRPLKKKVLAQLEPFLQRLVFSGRYTPLLKSHTIKPGDSLSQIAGDHQTTADALRRINGLKSDVIQPRQRLRILPGKVKIFVDKSDFILWIKVDDRIFGEFPVGLGRDNATPTGRFVIRIRQKDPTWWRPGEPPIPAGDQRNILGSRWLGFQETQDLAGFGIHGTSDPASVGKESSAGCIRMRNQDIELVYDFVPYGTEVLVEN